MLLGLGGDTRDRDLLLLLGSLDELTLYAAVALHRYQPDGDRAVHTLARQVAGCGRILAAMAEGQGGPAPGLADYAHAVPVLRRYADLVPTRAPTIAALRDLIGITLFFRRPPGKPPWQPVDIAYLTARYEALLHEPHWRTLVLDHLADPHRPDFHLALHPADVLDIDPTAPLLARLETGPSLLDPAWSRALRGADRRHAAHILDLAERRLTTTPRPERDHALLVFAHLLRGHPAHGWPLLRSALTDSTAEARRTALTTLAAWPAHTLTPEAADLLHPADTPRRDEAQG
ncbi:hypothetical protein AB0469_31325 [Streptomyces sp. NPDC093801]|uniref:hypothetical protein n=1 Tax=Streptomyces sp. NPDC093801 TaxID=3155203 RepID=UPI0034507D68